MPTREDVVRAARSYLNVPFVHQGRSRAGIDCAGLLICVAHDLKLTGFEYRNYHARTEPEIVMEAMVRSGVVERKPIWHWEPGDYVVLKNQAGYTHTAIVGRLDNDLSLIHAYNVLGKVVEHRLDEQWSERVRGCFALKGIDNG